MPLERMMAEHQFSELIKLVVDDVAAEDKNGNVVNSHLKIPLEVRVIQKAKIIREEGKQTFGVSSECNPQKQPEWFDRKKFTHAQQLHRTYGAIISFVEFYGLMLGMNIHASFAPLLVTGNSETVPKLFSRYLSTIVHVNNWYTHDPFDSGSMSYKSLKMVRGLHRQVATKLNQISGRMAQPGQELWLSQFDMMQAQFSFFGLMTMFPEELGFHFTSYDFGCIFHFWRTIGYCLGMEDRFNLCSGPDDETFALVRSNFYKNWLPKIQKAPEKTGTAMAKGIALAMSRMSFLLNYNALLHYSAPFMGFDRAVYPLESFTDKFAYWLLCAVFRIMTRSVMLCWILTQFGRFRLWTSVVWKSHHEQVLEQKYPNLSFNTDERCPFSVSINYSDAIAAKLY